MVQLLFPIITAICISYISARRNVVYVVLPLPEEKFLNFAGVLHIDQVNNEIFLPCANCYFIYDEQSQVFDQYIEKVQYGVTIVDCTCAPTLEMMYSSSDEEAWVDKNSMIHFNGSVYYGVMKSNDCRMNSIKSIVTTSGRKLAVQFQCH